MKRRTCCKQKQKSEQKRKSEQKQTIFPIYKKHRKSQ